MSFCKSVTKPTWRTLGFFISRGGHANPFDEGSRLRGPKNNVTLLSLSQGIWINCMQSICQNKCSPTCWDNITPHPRPHPSPYPLSFSAFIKNFPDNDKMSCNSRITHLACTQGGTSGTVGEGGAFLHFWALECSSPITTPTFSFTKLVATCHQKTQGIIVIFLLY